MIRTPGGRPSLFRGSELPRLLLLAGIALAGWPMVLLFAQNRAERPEKPPAPAGPKATELTPVRPDEGVEFQAIRDNLPMQVRENAAYAALLERARQTPPKDLAAQARRDIYFTHLFERPGQYRGVPVHIEGTARKVLSYEINPEIAPRGRVFEAWTYSDENPSFPYVLVFEEPPADLVVAPDLHQRVVFDGYFLKILKYLAGDKPRRAPMLVGRLRTIPAAGPSAPIADLRDYFKRNAVVVALVVLFAYLMVRGVFQVRRVLALEARPKASGRIVNDEIAPERLDEWLRSIPDEPDEPGPAPR